MASKINESWSKTLEENKIPERASEFKRKSIEVGAELYQKASQSLIKIKESEKV